VIEGNAGNQDVNSTPYILSDRAGALANYPHARRAGDFIFVSGVSSRRFDNTHAGVTKHDDGRVELDIREQTRAVIENIGVILEAAGAGLEHVVDITVFLVDMKDYPGMNEVYNEYFEAQTGPSRTTVAVHQLPHPNLLIEMKAVALAP
jgi:2-aminomuconate deaminase